MIKSDFNTSILEKSLRNNARIILPELEDERVIKAIEILKDLGFEIVSLDSLRDKFQIYKGIIKKKKFTDNWTDQMLEEFLAEAVNYSLVALDNDDIDGVVAGATISSADLIRSSIRIVGLENDTKILSSSFLMIAPDSNHFYTFSDCAVVPEPNSNQLSSIAYHASKTHSLLANEEPKVAFLSFSTKGSAEHYKIKKVQDAISIFKKQYPSIIHDGEMQFDAAINTQVAKNKNADEVLSGNANVFIFPDLDSGNISYKITQYLGKYQALGPLLQGLKKPVHDLSRGCSIEDIVSISLITALQKK